MGRNKKVRGASSLARNEIQTKSEARPAKVVRISYQLKPHWPCLAWLARCHRSASEVSVFHGIRVEVADEWFCEGLWDGDYDEGGFDRTDIFAGSGGRVRGEELTFVSSGSTVDRLQSLQIDNDVWVSNSLACLLAATDASVDPTYQSYYDDAISILRGLHEYKRFLHTSIGEVLLTYFDNLTWDGQQLERKEKVLSSRDFSGFSKYYGFLESSMERLCDNMAASARTLPIKMLGALSTGYDSTAVTVLANRFGCDEVVTFDQARGGDDDSGQEIARYIGVRAIVVARDQWRNSEQAEVPFIASYSSGEDVNFKGAEPYLMGRVLMTGFHGDKIWDKRTADLSQNIVRGDASGLSLSEYRLQAGFINCAVPFWGAKQVRDVNALSNSTEMLPWDVAGDYSRPVCRRIGEEAGIPRNIFGVRKRAITTNPNAGRDFRRHGRQFLTQGSMKQFMAWLKRYRVVWLRRGITPPVASKDLNYLVNLSHMTAVDITGWLSRRPLLWRYINCPLYKPQYLNKYIFPWAIEQAKTWYDRQSSHEI